MLKVKARTVSLSMRKNKIINKGKVLALLSLIIPFSLCSCNSQKPEDAEPDDDDTQQETSPSSTILRTTGDLKISLDDKTTNEFFAGGYTFEFIGAKNEDNKLSFYDMPVYQYPTMPEAEDGYRMFGVQFVNDNGGDPKNVFLSSFSISHISGIDFSNAVRVAFLDEENKVKFILGKNPNGETISTKGTLDLNATNKLDRNHWDMKDVEGDLVEYTTGADTLTSNPHSDAIVSDDNYDQNKALATSEHGKMLTIIVWIDFWACQSITEPYSRSFITQNFKIEMTFVS